ncbi:hypothetical protein QFZ75_008017 [Streptomyces sp. V3I8]|uniref:hypothetical protein n=1 Tax=Streptomyces sp. V3I8 TaxID=3042279 RepID=UPI00277E91BA|nr:hypothetical protein [Streptomyces sp. V3I8]MDQ1041515.1 hypothetical protein [Streptomyces sp. V3I8]
MPATSRLSDPMIRALLGALCHKNSDGRYCVFAPQPTIRALIGRGKAGREEFTGRESGALLVRYHLTEEGVTYLREALTFVLGKRGEDRDAVWTEWFAADRSHVWALIDFLGLTGDTYKVVTTTPHERKALHETLSRADAWERMSDALRNGQRITIDGRSMTVHTKLGARWTFTAQDVPTVEVDDVQHRMYVGVLRDDAKDMGLCGPDNVRAAIVNGWTDGHRAERQEDGTVAVGYSWFVPQRPVPWVESGEMLTDAGGVGGDIQIGNAAERRFTHTTLPGRVVDVTACPIKGDGSTSMPAEDAPIYLQQQVHTTICRDVEDPGGTEEFADITYPDLPEAYSGTYATVTDAEAAARRLVASTTPEHIGWDGVPDYPTETWCAERAAELLGAGRYWVKHFRMFGQVPRTEPVNRTAALELITWAMRHGGWQCYRADTGGVNLESPTGESSYWLEPLAEDCDTHAGEPADSCETCAEDAQEAAQLVDEARKDAEEGGATAEAGRRVLSDAGVEEDSAMVARRATEEAGPAPVDEEVTPAPHTVYLIALVEPITGYSMVGERVRAEYVREDIRTSARSGVHAVRVGTEGMIRVGSLLFIPQGLAA